MHAEVPRVHALDGLRGLAVAAVVAFHLGRLSGGWLGVDAFFTLSGYLITSLLLDEARRGGPDLRRFWRRRVRRLQPAAIVTIAAIVATARWWAPAGTGTAARGDALASLFSVANWHMLWSHQPYAAGGSPSAFEHFWSLAIEEQFYLLWPIVFLGLAVAVRRHVRKAVFAVAMVGMIASWALLASYGLQRGYLSTGSRVGAILAGAALACVMRRGTPRVIPSAFGVVGVVGMMTLWIAAGWPPHLPLAAIIPIHTGLALLAIAGLTGLLAWGPLALVGRVSYGIYLWHWPVIVILTPERLGQNEFMTDVIRLAVIAALTTASWVLIERPVRHERVLRSTRFVLPIGAAAAVAAVVLGASAVAPTPIWARANGRLVVATPKPVAAAHRAPPKPHGPRHPQRVLVIGDSVPTSLLSGFDASGSHLQVGEGRLLEDLTAAGVTAAAATITACPVLDEAVYAHDIAQRGCAPIVDRALTNAFANFRADLVVWFDVADGYEIVYPNGVHDDPMKSPAGAAALRARYATRLAYIAKQHVQVVFVSPGPTSDGHDDVDLRGNGITSMAFLDQTLHAVASEHRDEVVGVIDMSDLTCPTWRKTRHCPDEVPFGGHYREHDGMHYEYGGAVIASKWLATRIETLDLRR